MAPAAAPDVPRDVLASFGLAGGHPTSVDDGRHGHTWRVQTKDADVAVRASTPTSDVYVATHLEALRAADIPVPEPRRTVAGEWWLRAADHRWSATTWIDGEPVTPGDGDAARRVGVLLAKAHRVGDPGRSAAPARRDGWWPLLDFAESPRVGDWSLRSAMVRLGQPRPHRVTVVADLMRRCDLHLHPLRREVEAHPVVAHYDVHPGNVLRLSDDRVALLDWDFAHPDHRAADVAVAMRGWPGAAEELLAGYESETPLTDAEHAALPLLSAARGLDHLATRIAWWADDRHGHELTELVDLIDREVEDLLPRLESYQDERVDPRRARSRG